MRSVALAPGQHCAACFKKFEAASGAGHDRIPKAGDWNLCFGCGTLHRFDTNPKGKGLRVRPALPADVAGADLEDLREIARVTGLLLRFHSGERIN